MLGGPPIRRSDEKGELMMLDPPKGVRSSLFVVASYSYRKVAEALGITVVAARSRLSKAVKLLLTIAAA